MRSERGAFLVGPKITVRIAEYWIQVMAHRTTSTKDVPEACQA